MPTNLPNNMALTSNYCEQNHKPIQMMKVDGKEVCPKCELLKEEEKLRIEQQKLFEQTHDISPEERKRRVLLKKSILIDQTILDASFETYIVKEKEETENKGLCLDIANRLVDGQVFNTFIQGNPGAGKSHLGYSILRYVNDSEAPLSCVFVNIEEMFRLIKDSFNNHESRYTEKYFVDLMTDTDVLVLDDLGAEVGAIDTKKQASDFIQRILYAVTSARQDKVTISTSNLSSKQLIQIYDRKPISRLLRNTKYVIFENTKDKRMTQIPF